MEGCTTDRKAVCGFAGELEISLSSWIAVSTDRIAVCGITGGLDISILPWIAVSTDRIAVCGFAGGLDISLPSNVDFVLLYTWFVLLSRLQFVLCGVVVVSVLVAVMELML